MITDPLVRQALALITLTMDDIAHLLEVSRTELESWRRAPETMPTGVRIRLGMALATGVAPTRDATRAGEVAVALALETQQRYTRALGAQLVAFGRELQAGTLSAEDFGAQFATWLECECGGLVQVGALLGTTPP